MKRILLAFSILLSAMLQLAAQTAPPTNLSGSELKIWLKTNWYDGKHNNLTYSTARGKMYNYIDNYDNKVTCVYSGYQETKAYSESNTSTTMSNINCEHSIPQSWFGSSSPMVSDIHHLYPTVIQWNSDRGSDPFAEIPDNQTTKWIRGNSSQTSIPTSNIDEYSEDTNSQFEPREDHKGNLARTAFYFYTMYPSQAGNITRLADMNTLYQWHLQDPVDERERERNRRTEVAQGNRNPYIDYPELVAKAWGFAAVNCDPKTQLSNLIVSAKTTTSLTLTWTNGSGDRRLIVVKEGSTSTFVPSGAYTGVNSNFNIATDQGNGNRIVYYDNGASVTVTGLRANTSYYVQAFESCATDNAYNTTSAKTITTITPDYTCTGVPNAATALTSANVTQNSFSLSWVNGSGDGRVVLIRKDEAPAFVPQAGSVYTGATDNYATAATLPDGSKLIYSGMGSNLNISGLQAGSLYFVKVFEACSNGSQYETTAAPTLAITTGAANNPPTNNGSVVAMQDFNSTANDGWVVTSGFSTSTDNTGYPEGQRLRSGGSLQASVTARTVDFNNVDVTGKQDVYLQLYNSVISTTTGNGIEANDYLEVYVALNGVDYGTTPDIRITGDATDNNVRYGMNGTATLTTAAGTALGKTFVKANGEINELAIEKAPSKLQVTIPNGTTSIKARVVIKTSGDKEIWNIDDVGLYAAAASADCDELALEGHAGEDKMLYAGQSAVIGAAAIAGYTYSWLPAGNLSNATIANPTVTLTTPGTYIFTVKATKDGCTSTDDVTVTIQEMTSPAVDNAAVCAGESATLKINNPAQDITYKWYSSETAGNLLATGVTFTTATLNSTTSYYVEAVNTAGMASVRTKVTVTVGAPAAVTITGSDRICEGETITYTVAKQNTASYSWSVPTNWVIVSGQGTSELRVKAGSNSGQVYVAVSNNCGQSAPAVLQISVTAPVANNNINPSQTICVGQAATTINGSVPTGGTGSYMYQWQTSTDGVNYMPLGGANGQNYTPNALTTTTYIRRTVTSGACGQNMSEAVKITVNQLSPKPIITQNGNVLIASVAGTTYEWKKDGVTIANATKQSITIAESGNYTVRVQSEGNCYSVYSDSFAAILQPTGIYDELIAGIMITPNPTQGKIFISTIEPLQQIEVTITNGMGNIVYRSSVNELLTQFEVDLSSFSAGLYIVQLQTKKLRIVRKVVLTK